MSGRTKAAMIIWVKGDDVSVHLLSLEEWERVKAVRAAGGWFSDSLYIGDEPVALKVFFTQRNVVEATDLSEFDIEYTVSIFD